jgi:preprotein translocase subunit SecA
MEGLIAALRAMGIDGEGTTDDELWEIGGKEAILEHLVDVVDKRLEARAQEIGENDWAMVERFVLLRTIDSLWVEHLTEVDDMRRGIGLRGYAQQDPLNEFRREAFRLYEELRGLIRHQVATSVFRVNVVRQPAPAAVGAGSTGGDPALAASLARGAASMTSGGARVPGLARPAAPLARGIGESRGDQPVGGNGATSDGAPRAAAGLGPAATGPRPGYTPGGDRIGRNDACWCGSGQKYKKCHGR